jgi:hypothetical protein
VDRAALLPAEQHAGVVVTGAELSLLTSCPARRAAAFSAADCPDHADQVMGALPAPLCKRHFRRALVHRGDSVQAHLHPVSTPSASGVLPAECFIDGCPC